MKATKVIERDHQAAKELFDSYKKAGTEKEKDELSAEIFAALSAHEKMEDTHFYPVVLEAAPENDKPALTELEEEQKDLESETLKVRAITIFVDRDKELLPLMDKVLAHAKKEESVLLVKADQLLSKEKLEELGAKMEPDSAVANSKK